MRISDWSSDVCSSDLDLLDHLGARGCKVPRFIPDCEGRQLQQLAGRPACLIEFLTGISVTEPTAAQSHAAGRALGEMHGAAADFAEQRPMRSIRRHGAI